MNPSLALLPCAYDAGKLYSVLPDTGTGDFTVNRNGTATYFDKDGILRTAQANEPRLDFDPLTGDFKGILVEPSATNFITNTNTIAWGSPSGTLNTNDSLLGIPSLRMLNNTVQGAASSGLVRLTRNVSIPVVNGDYLCYSFYVKNNNALGSTFTAWMFGDSPNTVRIEVVFNFVTNTLLSSISQTNTNDLLIQSTNLGDGIYRVFFSARFLATSTVFASSFAVYNVGGDITFGIPQIERGKYPTSYIPTTNAQVTRPADIITVPNYSTLFGSRNQRHIELGSSKLGFLNEDTLQLPEGHNKLVLEKLGSISAAETTQLGTTTLKYGVRTNIKSERDQILALNPSLVMIPGKGSAGSLQTIFPNDGSADFTVSRNGTATFLGANGLIQTAQANEPRLEFNTDGSFRGVLVEPAATNLLLSSEEFEDVYWTKVSVNVTTNQTSVTGLQTASLLTSNTELSSQHDVQRIIGFNASTTYTFSAFFKKESARYAYIGSLSSGWIKLIIVDLDTLAVTFRTTGDEIDTITNYGNGWYRISVTGNSFGGTIRLRAGMTSSPTSESSILSLSDTIQIFGLQLEVGSVATSYIPTVATTITRPADTISSQLLNRNTTQWSVFFDITYQNDFVSQTSDVSANPLIWYFRRQSSGQVNFWNQNTQQNLGSFTFSTNTVKRFKGIILFNGSTISTFVNGSKVGNQITPTNLSPFTNFLNSNSYRLQTAKGNLIGLFDSFHFVNNLSIIPTALTDAQAIALTTL